MTGALPFHKRNQQFDALIDDKQEHSSQSEKIGWRKVIVVAELKVVLTLITLGFKFQECAAHSNKSNNSNLTFKGNLLIVMTVKRKT